MKMKWYAQIFVAGVRMSRAAKLTAIGANRSPTDTADANAALHIFGARNTRMAIKMANTFTTHSTVPEKILRTLS
jgi:hypothetical protein